MEGPRLSPGPATGVRESRVGRLAVAVGFLVWCAAALALQILSWSDQRQHVARPKAPAETWRLENLGAARLGRCLSGVGQRVEPGSVTAFSAPGRADETFLFAWAVYLLPERRIVLRTDLSGPEVVDFVFSFGRGLGEPGLRPVLETACGSLYAVDAVTLGGAR